MKAATGDPNPRDRVRQRYGSGRLQRINYWITFVSRRMGPGYIAATLSLGTGVYGRDFVRDTVMLTELTILATGFVIMMPTRSYGSYREILSRNMRGLKYRC